MKTAKNLKEKIIVLLLLFVAAVLSGCIGEEPEAFDKDKIQIEIQFVLDEQCDAIKNKDINLIINTPVGRTSKYDDSYIRMRAIQYKIPYLTSMAAAEASVEGIEVTKESKILPKAIQDYYRELE